MSQWYIQLDGDSSTLKEAAKTLKSKDLTISFNSDYDCFILQSNSFEAMENHLDVYHKSLEIVADLNGPIKLAVGGSSPIRVAKVVELKDDGTKQTYIYGSGNFILPSLGIDMTISINNGAPIEISQAAPVPKWFELQRKYANIRKAFEVYKKQNLDWGDLYSIYETIQEDIRTKPYKNGWTTKPKESNFTQTANYYRHGKSTYKLPDNPMTLEHAKNLIDNIFQQWLDSKAI